jgi:hypothetical protein
MNDNGSDDDDEAETEDGEDARKNLRRLKIEGRRQRRPTLPREQIPGRVVRFNRPPSFYLQVGQLLMQDDGSHWPSNRWRNAAMEVKCLETTRVSSDQLVNRLRWPLSHDDHELAVEMEPSS